MSLELETIVALPLDPDLRNGNQPREVFKGSYTFANYISAVSTNNYEDGSDF